MTNHLYELNWSLKENMLMSAWIIYSVFDNCMQQNIVSEYLQCYNYCVDKVCCKQTAIILPFFKYNVLKLYCYKYDSVINVERCLFNLITISF